MHRAYVCTLALDCFILLLFYFIKGVLALYHYSCFPFLSTFLYPPSLSQKAKFWLNVAFWKRKIHGIYYTENWEEDKQYHKLFFQIQMFDLLTFPNFNFVAIWGKFRFTCATNKSSLIPSAQCPLTWVLCLNPENCTVLGTQSCIHLHDMFLGPHFVVKFPLAPPSSIEGFNHPQSGKVKLISRQVLWLSLWFPNI